MYQLSGVYASGLTPLVLTALIAANHQKPWLACGYLVLTAVINVIATRMLKPGDADPVVAQERSAERGPYAPEIAGGFTQSMQQLAGLRVVR